LEKKKNPKISQFFFDEITKCVEKTTLIGARVFIFQIYEWIVTFSFFGRIPPILEILFDFIKKT
jgi:hypothetical protein